MGLQDTPRANRPHIGLFGNRNAGKSSLLNAITGQAKSLVSPVEGTTTDLVYQTFELERLGPVVFIDTAGLDDTGPLGTLQGGKDQAGCGYHGLGNPRPDGPDERGAFLVSMAPGEKSPHLAGPKSMRQNGKCPCCASIPVAAAGWPARFSGQRKTGEQIPQLRQAIAQALPDDFWELTITGSLAQPGDLVLLVMPQDLQAPKGRLILPQVQTMRELLDKRCSVMSCTADCLEATLEALRIPPKLIITDSQVFPSVWKAKPAESLLTSFSILFAGYKGDIQTFLHGAKAIASLTENSTVLIAEACAHAPTTEDIGREKIPRLLRQRVGQGLSFTFLRGNDFPQDLSPYDLIIHCGACMFNRRHVIHRIAQANAQGIPISNYGVVLAYLTGILDQVSHT